MIIGFSEWEDYSVELADRRSDIEHDDVASLPQTDTCILPSATDWHSKRI